MTGPSAANVDLSLFSRSLWKRRRLVAFIVVIPSLCVALTLLLRPRSYEVTAIMDPGKIWDQPIENLDTIEELVSSDFFLDQVIHKLPWFEAQTISPEILRDGMVRVRASKTTKLVELRILSDTPTRAVELAQAVADMIAQILGPRYQASYDLRTQQLKDMEAQIDSMSRSREKLLAPLIQVDKSPQANPMVMILLHDLLERLNSHWFALTESAAEARYKHNSPIYTRKPYFLAPPVLPQKPLSRGTVHILIFTFLGSLLAATATVLLLDF